MKRFILFFSFIVLFSGLIHATTQMDARSWVEKVPLAVQSMNYKGTFIYQRNDKTDAMSITHAFDERGERERLFSLSGPKREVIRNNQMVTCVLGDKQSVVLNKRLPRESFLTSFPKDVSNLEENYRFELGGEARVAGHPCQQVIIKPRDDYRYGRRLCIEKETFMLLQTEVTDDKGEVIEKVMFTDIIFPESVNEKDLRPVYQDTGFKWIRERGLSLFGKKKPKKNPYEHWVFTDMPAGFARTTHRWHNLTEANQPVEHWVYSDGFANVSLYIEKAKPNDEEYAGMSRRGALNAFGTMINGYHITALGEVPLKTLEAFGRAVKYVP
ncbi:MAG: MucB/RseB C-terminal domain-containing protein [Gammaproteobacteria bacterium]